MCVSLFPSLFTHLSSISPSETPSLLPSCPFLFLLLLSGLISLVDRWHLKEASRTISGAGPPSVGGTVAQDGGKLRNRHLGGVGPGVLFSGVKFEETVSHPGGGGEGLHY